MAEHLEEAPIVGPLAPDENRHHRGFRGAVDAAEEGERLVVDVENHVAEDVQITDNSLIARPRMKYSRRIRAIVSMPLTPTAYRLSEWVALGNKVWGSSLEDHSPLYRIKVTHQNLM